MRRIPKQTPGADGNTSAPFIQAQQSIVTHPKTLRLERPTAVGRLGSPMS